MAKTDANAIRPFHLSFPWNYPLSGLGLRRPKSRANELSRRLRRVF